MVCDMARPASLTRERFVIEAVEWTPKSVRTGGPSGPLHEEWALAVRFGCQQPFRGAAYIDSEKMRFYSRDWARRAERAAVLNVQFQPYGWDTSSDVQVVAGGVRVAVESAPLKADPVAATVLALKAGDEGYTGEPLTVLRIPPLGAAVGVVLVRSTDTRGDRTRWRVRGTHVDGLGGYEFLASGRRSGWTPLPA